MPKRRIDIWDIIFWIALAVLIFYIVAKLFGWINTPEWVELIPLITLVFLIGAFYQKVITFIFLMERRTSYLKIHLDSVEQKINNHDQRIALLETRHKHK